MAATIAVFGRRYLMVLITVSIWCRQKKASRRKRRETRAKLVVQRAATGRACWRCWWINNSRETRWWRRQWCRSRGWRRRSKQPWIITLLVQRARNNRRDGHGFVTKKRSASFVDYRHLKIQRECTARPKEGGGAGWPTMKLHSAFPFFKKTSRFGRYSGFAKRGCRQSFSLLVSLAKKHGHLVTETKLICIFGC